MAKLKPGQSFGKCVVCWQKITERSQIDRPAMWFQGRLYHNDCWERKYKTRKKARTLRAKTKKSF